MQMQFTRGEFESFITAFSDSVIRSTMVCKCGNRYYDSDANASDWEPGEREALESDESAMPIDGGIMAIFIHGSEYCDCCDCWLEKAVKVIRWLSANRGAIARFLNIERQRKITEAEASHVVAE